MRNQRTWAAVMAASGILFAWSAAAQPSFTEVTPTADPLFVTPPEEDFWINAVAPADVDGDGDLDLAVVGFYVVYDVSATDMLVIFSNDGPDGNGAWSFTSQEVPLNGVSAGASDLAWGDHDSDGDPDLALASEGVTVIYRNDAGVLTQLPSQYEGYFEDSNYTGAYDLRSLTWADADNDGDLDLLIPSVVDFDAFGFKTQLLRNDGDDGVGGWVFTVTEPGFDPSAHANTAWADADGDEDLDLFMANVGSFFVPGYIRRFRNDGGVFTSEDLLGIAVEHGLADWGDYDGDGDLDVIVAGNIQEADQTFNTVLRIYTNDGATYSQDTLIDAPNADWLDLHAATWADYDSDGDTDLLITGNYVGDGEIVGKSEVFGNDGNVFTALGVQLPAPVDSVGRGGAFTWLDLDGDGDLDYLVAGAYFVPEGNGLVEAQIHIYQNDAAGVNLPPGAPSQLTASPDGDSVILSWSAASDDSTSVDALTYDLEVSPAGSVAEGTRKRLPEPGNVSAVTGWALRGLPSGDYLWTVRAVDSAFNDGPAAQGTFTIDALSALRSVNIVLRGRNAGDGARIIGAVVVENEKGDRVADAVVTARWTRPSGQSIVRTATTNRSGVAIFSTRGPHGTYTLRILDIAAPGGKFDAAGSVLAKSITF